jgi:ubiquinone/menaquinone biosynthesis C-methylase UbiE
VTVDNPWETSAAVERWRQMAERRARTLGPATERMLDAAGVCSGCRVLDVAAGTGDQTLLAAARVGADGSVLATDISERMLEVATEVVRAAGLRNVSTLVADASALGGSLEPASFDAAICRFGLMFMPDVASALRAVLGALKPGARLAALVWSAPELNPSMGIPMEVIRSHRGMPSPAPTIVQAFSLSAEGRLQSELETAGFARVAVEPVPVTRVSKDLDEAFAASTVLNEMLGELSASERKPLDDEIRSRFSAYVQPDGSVVMPGQAWLGSATRPA